MIANRFKMRSDVRTYSLGGHACTSAIIVVELAQQLLKVGSTFYLASAGLCRRPFTQPGYLRAACLCTLIIPGHNGKQIGLCALDRPDWPQFPQIEIRSSERFLRQSLYSMPMLGLTHVMLIVDN